MHLLWSLFLYLTCTLALQGRKPQNFIDSSIHGPDAVSRIERRATGDPTLTQDPDAEEYDVSFIDWYKPRLVLSQIHCEGRDKDVVWNGIVDSVAVLDVAKKRLKELYDYLNQINVPPIEDEQDDMLVATFRLYQSVIWRYIPTQGDPHEGDRQLALEGIENLRALAVSISANIKDENSDASKATEIYCGDSWMITQNLDDEEEGKYLWDDRASIDPPYQRRVVRVPRGIPPFSPRAKYAKLPILASTWLAGPRTTVFSVNPSWLEFWGEYIDSEHYLDLIDLSVINPEETEGELETEPKELYPWELFEAYENYTAGSLVTAFATTRSMTNPCEPLRAQECLRASGDSQWDCLKEVADSRPLEAAQNPVAFGYLALGLYLSTQWDWSLGMRLFIDFSRDKHEYSPRYPGEEAETEEERRKRI